MNINKLEFEYKVEKNDIFCDNVLTILDQLTYTDRRIIILYSELNSYRKVADIIGVSHTLISKHIKRIKSFLKIKLKEYDY